MFDTIKFVPVLLIIFPAFLAGAERVSVPVEDLQSVRLHGHGGEIVASASNDNVLRISVEVRLSGRGKSQGVCGSPSIRAERDGKELHITISPELPDQCSEFWTLSLPPHLAADFGLVAGRIIVTGLSGGIKLKGVAVKCTLDVPSGPVDADCGVGNIDAAIGPASYSELEIDSDVGAIEVSLNGYRIHYKGAPGSGDQLRLEGNSGDRIKLHADVGDIKARILSKN